MPSVEAAQEAPGFEETQHSDYEALLGQGAEGGAGTAEEQPMAASLTARKRVRIDMRL
jgi:hypothetical protein